MPDSAAWKSADSWIVPPAVGFGRPGPQADDPIASNLMLEGLQIWRERAKRDGTAPRAAFISDIDNMRSLHFDWNSAQSEMDLRDPVALTADYTQVMTGFLFFIPRPARIEMVGLGGGSLPKFCHHILPEADITVVELNPKIIGLRDAFCIPPDDHRFRVICGDGAEYVARAGAAPDILLVDGFDEFGQPPQLCSPEFYAYCYERLAPGGMMIVNLWGGGQFNATYTEHMRQSFKGNICSVPTERGFNRAVIGRKGTPLALSRAEIAEGSASFTQTQAGFLRSVGRRIRRQIGRVS